MEYKGLPTRIVENVAPTAVQEYARATGWIRIPDIAGGIAVYRRPSSETDEVIVPQNSEFGDFGRRMTEAIASLAEFERRAPWELLNELLYPVADVLRFRRDDTGSEDGTIALEEGLRLLTGTRKALLAAACSAVHPQAFHPRLSRGEAEEFLSACRLGQTERGSFVATIICPLETPLTNGAVSQASLFPEEKPEPFGRKTTMLLMRSIVQIVDAIAQDHPERVTQPVEGDMVISANLCEALLELRPTSERSSLSASVQWARTAPPHPGAPSTVRLRHDHFPIIEEAARLLRPNVQPQRDFFVGKIDSLSGEPGRDGSMEGQVILAFQGEDQLLKARLDLAPAEYALACDAHKFDQFVYVAGVLHRGHRVHSIRENREFRLLDPASLGR